MRPVNAGKVRREVHRDAIAKVDEIRASLGKRRRNGFIEGSRKNLLLVEAEKIAPKNLELKQPALSMGLAMQRQQHLIHDHRAFVIERLRKVRVA